MHTGKLTKIIATIGPASDTAELIKELIVAGVNIFRFNTKHNTKEWHLERIHKVRHVAKELGLKIGILVDLQGPEIRIDTYEGKSLQVRAGEELIFADSFELTNEALKYYPKDRIVRIAAKQVFLSLQAGDKFSIDDGFIDFEVTQAHREFLFAKVLDTAEIKNRKGLNLVGKDIDLPSLTASDIERIDMAKEGNADFIALSFVRSKEDVAILRKEMAKKELNAHIVAKIESQKGVDNIDEILDVSDAVMVARGDLGIELPIEHVTFLQKEIIKKCRNKNKPVIVATQMLQSMCDAPRPTRAEAADVANAVYDETDCVMLSGETASGKYPVKAVEVMKRILKYNESKRESSTYKPKLLEQTHVIVNAVMSILNDNHEIKIAKVIIFTETGYTARVLASFRPKIPVIAISESAQTVNQLTMSHGVISFHAHLGVGEFVYPTKVIENLTQTEFLNKGDKVLLVHGKHWNTPASTNALVILTV